MPGSLQRNLELTRKPGVNPETWSLPVILEFIRKPGNYPKKLEFTRKPRVCMETWCLPGVSHITMSVLLYVKSVF